LLFPNVNERVVYKPKKLGFFTNRVLCFFI